MRYRLIDRIPAYERGRSITGIHTVGFGNAILSEVVGRDGCLPESLVLAAACELAWWASAEASGWTRAVLPVAVTGFTFTQVPVHAERLTLVLELHPDAAAVSVTGDRGAASGGRLELAERDLASLADAQVVAEDWLVLRGGGA